MAVRRTGQSAGSLSMPRSMSGGSAGLLDRIRTVPVDLGRSTTLRVLNLPSSLLKPSPVASVGDYTEVESVAEPITRGPMDSRS